MPSSSVSGPFSESVSPRRTGAPWVACLWILWPGITSSVLAIVNKWNEWLNQPICETPQSVACHFMVLTEAKEMNSRWARFFHCLRWFLHLLCLENLLCCWHHPLFSGQLWLSFWSWFKCPYQFLCASSRRSLWFYYMALHCGDCFLSVCFSPTHLQTL